MEGTEKVDIYKKRLFSISKTASFSLVYSDDSIPKEASTKRQWDIER
ncbi:hypothetical protein [Flavobacterium piscisymbiosum]|uniref:Uncharacterized protein n=1 Tax=Flavobacterium piscisymbiosum TaxID=2893753 RepID=A0ABS8MDJ9_9FLAO|nr:hypothetical protein [Flavobacterium sp. F-30]MCC9063591.1 hypothetical protein [Flavobacterium sp. F-30]